MHQNLYPPIRIEQHKGARFPSIGRDILEGCYVTLDQLFNKIFCGDGEPSSLLNLTAARKAPSISYFLGMIHPPEILSMHTVYFFVRADQARFSLVSYVAEFR